MLFKYRCQWRRSSVFIVDFEHISRFSLVFLLLTLNKELVNISWVYLFVFKLIAA